MLQMDLDNIQNWCHVYLLRLNLLKCKVMHLGNSHVMVEYILHDESGEYVEWTMRKILEFGLIVTSNHHCIAPRL